MRTEETTLKTAIIEPRALRLARKSSLYESGELADGPSDESFILRLNTIIGSQLKDIETGVPSDMASAISNKGILKHHAELVAFGQWLMLEGQPGVANNSGKKPNPQSILKCVGACLLEINFRSRKKGSNLETKGRSNRTRAITKNDLAKRWETLFRVATKPSDFDAKLRSTKRLLSAYLDHLRSGFAEKAGKPVKSSPKLHEVYEALSGLEKAPTSKARKNISMPALVKMDPFDITLGYYSAEIEDQYRNFPTSPIRPVKLRYIPEHSISLSTSDEDRFVLKPDIAIKALYKTNALIDRLVILVDTAAQTSGKKIHATLSKRTNAPTFVSDLTVDGKEQKWGMPLPIPDNSKKTGYHFAIMIQGPSPKTLKGILDCIHLNHGISGSIGLHLIEVSVDFSPKDPVSVEVSILLREQIVGLLQRHHWTPHNLFLKNEPNVPRYVDARQFYDREKRPSYLFSGKKGDKFNSDTRLGEQSVRNRLLAENSGTELYLNSTLIKGAKNSEFMVSIQHKIADRRNKAKGTEITLSEDERRARVEVTLSGSGSLKERGLSVIDDLSQVSFRTLSKPFLSFRIGTTGARQHNLDDAMVQMRTRGVYGLELKGRAQLEQERAECKNLDRSAHGFKDKEGCGLIKWDELNQMVGSALDNLARRWSSFSWEA